MWEVVNRTPFAAAGYFLRDRDGAEHWCLAVRGRFLVRPDGLTDIAEGQGPVLLAPAYVDDDARELAAESDLAPFRRQADVLLRGRAMTPGGRPANAQPVEMRVGALSKRARVYGPRRLRRGASGWNLDGRETFSAVDLGWTNAIGGRDPFVPPDAAGDGDNGAGAEHPFNPVGRGWSSRLAEAPEGAEFDLAPIANPDEMFDIDGPLPHPHGFGPIQPGWRPRRDHAGTYDDAWRRDRAPLPPADFSESFHQAAPADQVYPGELKGGEPVELTGVHPDGPYGFRLPQLILEGTTWLAGAVHKSRFRIVSVSLDGSAKALDMVWNASLPCTGCDHRLEQSNVTLRQMTGVAR